MFELLPGRYPVKPGLVALEPLAPAVPGRTKRTRLVPVLLGTAFLRVELEERRLLVPDERVLPETCVRLEAWRLLDEREREVRELPEDLERLDELRPTEPRRLPEELRPIEPDERLLPEERPPKEPEERPPPEERPARLPPR